MTCYWSRQLARNQSSSLRMSAVLTESATDLIQKQKTSIQSPFASSHTAICDIPHTTFLHIISSPNTTFPPYYIWGSKYANCQFPRVRAKKIRYHGSMAISISIYILTPPRGSTSLFAVLLWEGMNTRREMRECFGRTARRPDLWMEGLESRLLWPVGFQPWVYGFAVKTRNNGNASRLEYLGWRILYLVRSRLMRLDIVCT